MTHFFISYAGNKRKEYIHLKNIINFNDTKYIVEPFCGSSALSFAIWQEYGDKFNYYLSDNDPWLIELYRVFINNDIEKIENDVTEQMKKITCKNDYIKLLKKDNKDVIDNFVIKKYSTFRIGLFNHKKKPLFKLSNLQIKFINFIKSTNVHIIYCDWFKLFNKFKDKKAIIIMDPPYIQGCNDFYSEYKSSNVYQFFLLNDMSNYKSNIYFILEDNWIIRLLFRDKKIISYDKRYEFSKKKTTHIIINNK